VADRVRRFRRWFFFDYLGFRGIEGPNLGDLSVNIGEGTIVGKLVSMSTLSGSFSAEFILIVALSASARAGSEAACGRSQFNPTSRSKSALPTKPKYFIKGINRLLLGDHYALIVGGLLTRDYNGKRGYRWEAIGGTNSRACVTWTMRRRPRS
jgi:hypothetical protein